MSFAPAATTDSQRKRRRWWRRPLVFCLVGGAAYILLSYPNLDEQPKGGLPRLSQLAAAAYDKLPGRGQGELQTVKPTEAPVARAVPVTITAAREGTLGIYLTGLGSVTASNMVPVRTRVSGHLVRVAFQERQFVRKGDLLAEIDPRPFQVQLAQAEGQMARNRALLRNAQRDLERFKVLLSRDLISKQEFDAPIATVD